MSILRRLRPGGLKPEGLFVPAILLLLILPVSVWAGTTGKIVGTVQDKETGETLPGVAVSIEGTKLGAMTDLSGEYIILNVPGGRYTLKATMIGYKQTVVKNVLVRPDLTTEVNVRLEPTVLEVIEPIVVEAERPLIQRDVTTSRTLVAAEELAHRPVDSIQQAVAQSAGATPDFRGVSFRGGRTNTGETIYMVDGISLQNPLGPVSGAGTDALATQLPEFSVEEMEIMRGSYPAEYGNAQSAIINVITKAGGSRQSGKLRMTFTPNAFEEEEKPKSDDPAEVRRAKGMMKERDPKRQHVQFSLGGPNPLARYFVPFGAFESGRYFISGEYLDYQGRWRGREEVNWNGRAKLTFEDRSGNKKLVVGYLQQDRDYETSGWVLRSDDNTVRENWDFIVSTGDTIWTGDDGHPSWTRPAGDTLATPRAFVVVDSLEGPQGQKVAVKNFDMLDNRSGIRKDWSNAFDVAFTHTLSPKTFYELKFSRFLTASKAADTDPWDRYVNGIEREVGIREMASDRFVRASIPILDVHYQVSPNALYLLRQEDTQVVYTLKGDITTQFTKTHLGKRGVEFKLYDIYRRYDGVASGDNIYRDKIDVTAYQAGAYVQEKFETKGMILNIGARMDYFDPNTVRPRDPDNPVNVAVQGETVEGGQYSDRFEWIRDPVEAETRWYWSPRIGVSYPITDRSMFRFSYGHFYQFPVLWRYYRNNRYNWDGAWKYIGNPNLKPEKTILYEAGVDLQFTDQLVLNVTGFYKDISNLIDFAEKGIWGGGRYKHYLYVNSAYGNVRGFEISLAQRRWHRFSGNLAYTFQIAEGKASSSRQSFLDLYDRKVPRTEDYPLDWDQRHTLQVTLDYRLPVDRGLLLGGWGANAQISYGSGLPYSSSTRGKNPPVNDKRYPSTSTTDLIISKDFRMLGGTQAQLFFEIRNLFDKEHLRAIQDVERYELTKREIAENTDLDGNGVIGDPTRPGKANPAGRFHDAITWGLGRTTRLGMQVSF